MIFLKFCWKMQMADFRPEKARQAFEQFFTLGIKSLGKMSSWANCHIGQKFFGQYVTMGILSLGILKTWHFNFQSDFNYQNANYLQILIITQMNWPNYDIFLNI